MRRQSGEQLAVSSDRRGNQDLGPLPAAGGRNDSADGGPDAGLGAAVVA